MVQIQIDINICNESNTLNMLYFLKKDLIHLRDRENKQGGGAGGEREAVSPLSREPNA